MPDPFEDSDDDVEEVDLGGGHSEVEALAKRMEAEKQTPGAPDWENASPDEAVDVPIEPSEEEDRRTRKEKREGRYQEMQAQSRQDREELRQLRADMAQRDAQMHQTLQLQAQAQQRASTPPAGPDAHQQELDGIYNQRVQLTELWNARLRDEKNQPTKEDAAKFMADSRELEDKYHDLRTAKTAAQQVKAAAPAPTDPRRAAIEAKHWDVLQNPAATLYMQGQYAVLQSEGRQDNMEMTDEVMDMARRKFALGKYKGRRNDPRTKAMYSGSPAGGTGGGASGEGPQSVKMTPGMTRIAIQMYPGISETEAKKKWARDVGPSFIKQERLEGR